MEDVSSAWLGGGARAKRNAQVPEDSPTTYTEYGPRGDGATSQIAARSMGLARESVKALIRCLGPILANAQGPDLIIGPNRYSWA